MSLQERRFSADSYANARPLIFSTLDPCRVTCLLNAPKRNLSALPALKNPRSTFLLSIPKCHFLSWWSEQARFICSDEISHSQREGDLPQIDEVYWSIFEGRFLLTSFRSDATDVPPRLFTTNLSTDPWSTLQPDWARDLTIHFKPLQCVTSACVTGLCEDNTKNGAMCVSCDVNHPLRTWVLVAGWSFVASLINQSQCLN